MSLSGEPPIHILSRGICLSVMALLSANLLAQSTGSPRDSAVESNIAIAAGTILPVRLNSTISLGKSRLGQRITGRIMQNISLRQGITIKEGSNAIGHIVDVSPANAGAQARIAFQFDKIISSHRTIPITTDLRVIAGFMELDEAQIPTLGAGESEVYRWLTTVQIGGDVVYGDGGPVIAGDGSHRVVGKRIDGGVVGQVRARPGTNCRGPLDGNDVPQALWLFSGDACGVYGLAHISIQHAGRTNPVGLIVLASDNGKLKIPSGAGMLLRTIAAEN